MPDEGARSCSQCGTLDLPGARSVAEVENRSDEVLARCAVHDLSRDKRFIWKLVWRIFGLLFVALGTLGTFTGWNILGQIKQLNGAVSQRIEQQFAEKEIGQLVRNVAQEQASSILRHDVAPEVNKFKLDIGRVAKELADSRNRLVDMEREVKTLQNSVDKQLHVLNEDVHKIRALSEELAGQTATLRLFLKAKQGDRQSYDDLILSSGISTNQAGLMAGYALADVNQSFDALFDSDLNRRTVVSSVTLEHFRPCAEEVLIQLSIHNNPLQRVAYINECRDRGWKFGVEELVGSVKNDKNIKVASSAVRAINNLAGKKFGTNPPFADVLEWWEGAGRSNEVYRSPMGTISDGLFKLQNGRTNEAIKCLENVVTNKNGFGFCYTTLAQCYLQKGDRTSAKLHLKRMDEECDNRIDGLVLYAKLLVEDGDIKGAMALLKKTKGLCNDWSTLGPSLLNEQPFKGRIAEDEVKKLLEPVAKGK